MLRKVKAWILGAIEFRSAVTRDFGSDLIETYDSGREFMHRITFRLFDR